MDSDRWICAKCGLPCRRMIEGWAHVATLLDVLRRSEDLLLEASHEALPIPLSESPYRMAKAFRREVAV